MSDTPRAKDNEPDCDDYGTPLWRQEDGDRYAIGGGCDHCLHCGRKLQVGDTYWLEDETLLSEFSRVVHDVCP